MRIVSMRRQLLYRVETIRVSCIERATEQCGICVQVGSEIRRFFFTEGYSIRGPGNEWLFPW